MPDIGVYCLQINNLPTTALTSLTFEVVTEADEIYKVAKMTINGFEFAQGKGEGLTWNNSTASQTFDYGEPSLKWTVETTSSTQ